MKVFKGVLLVLLMSVSMAGTSHASDEKGKSAWGEAIKGVQIRLSADSSVLKFGQIPTFKCDVRNKGPHKWKLPMSEQGYCLEVDGRIFTHPGDIEGWKLLKPGEQLSNVAIRGNTAWGRGGVFKEYKLALRTGKYTIRLGAIPQAVGSFVPSKPALCMSNPITVEVVSPDGMDEDPDLLGMTVYGECNRVKLSGWDCRGGDCGVDFESGRVTAMPADIRKASESKRVKWMSEQGIDAVANISDQETVVVGIDLAALKYENKIWSEMTAEKALEDMRYIKITARKTDLLGPARVYCSRDYVVETREGNIFRLNIHAVFYGKKYLTFSYSMVQQTLDSISVSRTRRGVVLKARPSIEECTGISIKTPENLWLYIRKDGSASFSFSNAGGSWRLPDGSFKFEQVYSTVALGEDGVRSNRPYLITFHLPYVYHDNPAARWVHYCPTYWISVYGHKHIGELFDKADALGEQHFGGNSRFQGFREHYPIKQPITED